MPDDRNGHCVRCPVMWPNRVACCLGDVPELCRRNVHFRSGGDVHLSRERRRVLFQLQNALCGTSRQCNVEVGLRDVKAARAARPVAFSLLLAVVVAAARRRRVTDDASNIWRHWMWQLESTAALVVRETPRAHERTLVVRALAATTRAIETLRSPKPLDSPWSAPQNFRGIINQHLVSFAERFGGVQRDESLLRKVDDTNGVRIAAMVRTTRHQWKHNLVAFVNCVGDEFEDDARRIFRRHSIFLRNDVYVFLQSFSVRAWQLRDVEGEEIHDRLFRFFVRVCVCINLLIPVRDERLRLRVDRDFVKVVTLHG
mmetsp:Transcript_3335/g.7535  ORF Transcript_3335/g.7535 Transcript_3335/m.7535 type:complete len:314 (-) Transcript_3335:316-1257(-)